MQSYLENELSVHGKLKFEKRESIENGFIIKRLSDNKVKNTLNYAYIKIHNNVEFFSFIF